MGLLRRIHPLALRFWLIYCSAALLLYLIFGVAVPRARYSAKVQQAKENLHSVQLALERFAVDEPGNGYPLSIEEVIRAGYLQELPQNPFSGEPMRVYEEGSTGLPPGDFIYIRRWQDGSTGGRPLGYSLQASF